MNKDKGLGGWQALKLGTMSAANIASNLLFQWLVLTMLGPGKLTDALFAGLTLPQLFTAIVSSSLTHVLVPILANETHEDQRRDAWTLFFYSAALFGVAAIGLIISATWWVPLIVPGFAVDAKLITVELASISILGLVFTGMSAVQAAVGYARYKFIWVDGASVLANLLSVLLLIWLLPHYGVWAAAWISVLRMCLQTTLLMPIMGRPVMLDRTRPTTQIAWQRLKPILIGASYYKLDPLVDRFLLSTAAAGSLSQLYLCQQLHSAASQIVSKALVVPAMTALSAEHKLNNQKIFFSILVKKLRVIFIVCLIGLFAIILVGEPLLRWGLVFGEFTIIHAAEMWVLLILSAGMFVGGAMGSMSSGAFYAQGDTITPTLLGSFAFTLGIFLKIAMFKIYGVHGLAIAISVYYILSLSIQLFVLWRRAKLDQ